MSWLVTKLLVLLNVVPQVGTDALVCPHIVMLFFKSKSLKQYVFGVPFLFAYPPVLQYLCSISPVFALITPRVWHQHRRSGG